MTLTPESPRYSKSFFPYPYLTINKIINGNILDWYVKASNNIIRNKERIDFRQATSNVFHLLYCIPLD